MNWRKKFVKLREERRTFIDKGNPRSVSFLVATWFGSGLLIPAPGTWGTLSGLFSGMFLHLIAPELVPLSAGALYCLSLWAINQIEKRTGEHDSSFIVIDEVVAIFFVLAMLPVYTLPYIVGGFVIFRILDAAKPFPISWFDEHIEGALGVMLDDVIAAAFTIMILWGIYLV